MNEQDVERVVLIAEDERDVRDAIAEALEDHDFIPLCAANGREALDMARRLAHKPCLILLDITMPEMDGRQFLHAQKQDPELRSVPVVVLTAHTDPPEVVAQMEAEGWLKKPVQLEELLSVVRDLCSPL
jgi:CheY-like chemotaxis protein